MAPAMTKPAFQAFGRIVQTGVDHFAVAARRFDAVARMAFEHDETFAVLRQPRRAGEAGDARADDRYFDFFH